MKRFSLPSYLLDYNSIWNPLMEASNPALAHQVMYPASSLSVCKSDRKKPIFRKLRRPESEIRNACCMIKGEILEKYGARRIELKKDEFIFYEGDEALYFFQVVTGSVKMVTNSSHGQEFIQGIFGSNDSFGEPPLISNFTYPSAAVALEPTVMLRLTKEKFLKLLKENFDIHLRMDQVLCQRLKYKSLVLSEISFNDPEHRLHTLLTYLKEERIRSGASNGKADSYSVPFTRQQLADMTGLRVETVIRTVKKMEEDGKLKIVGHKIQF